MKASRRVAARQRAAIAMAIAGVVGAVGAESALATSYGVRITNAPVAQSQGRWAERMARADYDYNGDQVNDLFVADPMEDVGSTTNQGRVYLVSGAAMAAGTTTVLKTYNSPAPQGDAKFGFFISVLGDVSGDAKPDIAIGTDAQDVGSNSNQGKAWVFNADTATSLYALDNPAPQGDARFGSRIGRAGDLTGDGKSELIVGASSNDVPAGCGSQKPVPSNCKTNQGQAFIFNGATGGLIRTLNYPNAGTGQCSQYCGTFGLAVQGPGDAGPAVAGDPNTSDGVPDQLVTAGSYNSNQGRMYLFSGADGSLIRTIDDPEPQSKTATSDGAFFGFQDAAPLSPGDVDNDGFVDLYGNGFLQNAPLVGQGKAWVFSGKTGAVLYALNDPTPETGGQFGWSMDKTLNNADTTPDLYVGQAPHHVDGSTGSGGTYIFNGVGGTELQRLELPTACVQLSTSTNLGPNLGWSLAAPGDLNGDGSPDYVAGAPFRDVGSNVNQGQAFVFASNATDSYTC